MEKIYFEGVVVDQNQLPLPEVTVVVLQGPGEYPDIAAITNEKGEFSFSELTPGEYQIKFMSDSVELERWVQLSTEASRHTFVISPGK
jgi:protocatechuate 3,4-dioxygenase beta subunit